MTRPEVAVWTNATGEPPLRGVVTKRGGPQAQVHVKWDEGNIEKVRPGDPAVKYALEGSRRLEWLFKPKLLADQFKIDPAGVFVDVIRDEGKRIGTAQIKKRLVDLGLEPRKVSDAFEIARPRLRANWHIVIKGSAHHWSDVPVDPHADLRQLPPHDALDALLSKRRLSAEQKEALADAVRSALPARRGPR